MFKFNHICELRSIVTNDSKLHQAKQAWGFGFIQFDAPCGGSTKGC